MATQAKTVSGSSTIYTITDVKGGTATLTLQAPPGLPLTMLYSGGPLLQDGNALVSNLMQLLSTGLTPGSIPA